jgi:hypothetical protein
MTNDPRDPVAGPPGTDDLQFERVEPAAPPPQGLGEPITATSAAPAAASPGVTVCAACGEPITDVYFEARGKVVCPRCRDAVIAQQSTGSAAGRVLKAICYGIGAGVVGAAIWYGVRAATGYEIGLIAVVVGVLVGGAVRSASGGRGGVVYQLLAVLLTYLSIAATYAPDVVAALQKNYDVGGQIVATVITTIVLSLVAPFLGGLKNILGLLIIGFALYQAWVMNRPRRLTFNGPYRLTHVLSSTGAVRTIPPQFPPAGAR